MTLLGYEQRATLINEAENALTEAKRWNALCGPQAAFVNPGASAALSLACTALVNPGGNTANAEARIQAAVTRARNLLSRIAADKP